MEEILPSLPSVVSALIEPPIDTFNIDKLPPDLLKKYILELSYDDILNLCITNKKFSNICKDPYFWRNKIRNDFPDEDIPEIDIENEPYKFKAKYELLLADKLEEEDVRKLYREMDKEKDPIINEIVVRVQPLIDKNKYITMLPDGEFSEEDIPILARKFPKFKPLYQEILNIEKKYKPEIRNIERKIDKLNKARRIYYDE